ncbi:MAG: hypothetical protein NXY59_08715 [Aigarchaeota archaeon]|nr:hypothetical protein [Candidatus Pelearchaeum maunauluense]
MVNALISNGFKIKKQEPYFIEATTGASMKSWSNRIRVRFYPQQEGVWVEVESSHVSSSTTGEGERGPN